MLLRYVLKRILIFIPTLFAISLVIFFLNKYAPGDPVEILIGGSDMKTGSMSEMRAGEEIYDKKRRELNLHLPSFYFAFSSKAHSDTLHHIIRPAHKETLSRLADKTGNWENTQAYYRAITDFKLAIFAMQKDSLTAEPLIIIRNKTLELYTTYEFSEIDNKLSQISKAVNTNTATAKLLPSFQHLSTAFNKLKNEPTSWKKYVPAFHWHGMENQYHIWIFGDKPWISKSDEVLAISKQKLEKTEKEASFKTVEKGYYKIIPSFNLVENNGRRTEDDIKRLQLFEIIINGKKTVYSPKDILE